MRILHFSAFLFSCFLLFKCTNSTEYKTFSNCIVTTQYMWGSNAYSITWTIPAGSSSCILPLDLYYSRNIDISLYYYGGISTNCNADAYNWNCNTGSVSSCPVVMYSTTSSYDRGTALIKNYSTKTVYSNFIKLQYCGAPSMSTTITIYVYSTYYWYWTSSWQFVYIGIPIIVIVSLLVSVLIYIRQRNRRNRMLLVQQPILRPTVAISTTTSGSSNMGYQATHVANQPYYYPQQQQPYNNGNDANLPPPYNPAGYNQSGYIQSPPMKQ